METQKGLWDSIDPNEKIKDRLTFEINKEEVVTFPDNFDKPTERVSDYKEGEPYLVFDVIHQGEPKVIMTSAFTLIVGLKKLAPLAGKTVKIIKKLVNGKQNYEVSDTNQIPTSG